MGKETVTGVSATLSRGAGCDGSGGTYVIKTPRSATVRKVLLKAPPASKSTGVAKSLTASKGIAGIKTREACDAKAYFWMIPEGATEPICNPPGLTRIKVTLSRGAICKGRTSTRTILAVDLPASVKKVLLAAAIKERQARLVAK